MIVDSLQSQKSKLAPARRIDCRELGSRTGATSLSLLSANSSGWPRRRLVLWLVLLLRSLAKCVCDQRNGRIAYLLVLLVAAIATPHARLPLTLLLQIVNMFRSGGAVLRLPSWQMKLKELLYLVRIYLVIAEAR